MSNPQIIPGGVVGPLKIVGPVATRDGILGKKCMANVGHDHHYDHTTFVIKGSIQIFYNYEEGTNPDGTPHIVEGESKVWHQGERPVMKKEVHHTIKAMEDDTWYICVFSHRDFDGLVIEEYKGNREAYE